MIAVPVKTLKERLTEFAWMFAFCSIGALGLEYLHVTDVEKEKTEAFKLGFATAKKLLEQPLTEDQQAAIAVKWWSDSDDIKGARQRLCTNVHGNALKGSK